MALVGPAATALPQHRLPQAALREVAAALAGPGAARLLGVFDNARIDGRALAMPVEWYLQPHGFRERSAAYATVAADLAEQASRQALARAGLAAGSLGGVVAVSTTGIATPSLDARLCNRLGLRADAARLPVWGLGCAGGVAGLQRAAELADARGAPVLLVAVELCTLSFDLERVLRPRAEADKRALVAAGIFGDGCAAVVVQPGDAPPADSAGSGPAWSRLAAGRSHLFPGTERVMGWDVEDHNLDVVLSPEIPALVRGHAAGLTRPFLADNGIEAPDHWVLHPGGAKVVDAFREALGLSDHDLRHTNATLREHGNMSSPTVLFALARAQAEMRPGDHALLAALGPGFACEQALLEATDG